MPTAKQLLSLAARHGFTPSPRRGFVGSARHTAEGEQRLDFFTWSGAGTDAGIPRAYLVIVLSGAPFDGLGRRRLPLVEWPSEDQPMRRWSDVTEEFDRVFGPALGEPTADVAATLAELDARYSIS